MGPFPKPYKFEYILVDVDYVSKWAEAQALPTNDARVVISFLKKLFSRFGMPKALISDKGTHFCNKIIDKVMKRYVVTRRFSISHHPQTSGQVENMNRALKRILEKTVKDNPVVWSRKLDDALLAFRTAYKTPTRTTSYKLLYGKNYHLSFEIEHRAYWAFKNWNPDLIATAFGKHLEEKHVTWAQFGKKLDKNTTFQVGDFHPDAFTKISDGGDVTARWRRRHKIPLTLSRSHSDGVTIADMKKPFDSDDVTTTSDIVTIADMRKPLEDSTGCADLDSMCRAQNYTNMEMNENRSGKQQRDPNKSRRRADQANNRHMQIQQRGLNGGRRRAYSGRQMQ
ncbi:reverse transcriptase domain-containing protein [Tanacetum coccineum]